MNGLHTRRVLHDYAMQERDYFIRAPFRYRLRRFLRRILFGWIK